MIQRDMKAITHLVVGRQFITHVGALAAEERCATAASARRGAGRSSTRGGCNLGAGCASLFVYCTRVLHFFEVRSVQVVRGRPGGATLSDAILERRPFRRPCPRRAGRSCRRSHQDRYEVQVTLSSEGHGEGVRPRRTSCVMSCRLGTSRQSSSGRWAGCRRRPREEEDRRHDPVRRAARAAHWHHIPAAVTRAVWARNDGAVRTPAHNGPSRSADSSNTTTSSPSRMEAPRRWRISSCGAPRNSVRGRAVVRRGPGSGSDGRTGRVRGLSPTTKVRRAAIAVNNFARWLGIGPLGTSAAEATPHDTVTTNSSAESVASRVAVEGRLADLGANSRRSTHATSRKLDFVSSRSLEPPR